MGNSHNLVIVESPSKAKTIGRYLGSEYIVKASMGHLRDLPKSKMGVDLENDFTPQYIAVRGKESLIKELKADAAKAKILARLADEKLPVDLNDERFLREVLFYADRADVTEEITRLKSHFEQFEHFLTGAAESAGRSMDFLIQEMFREITTLGNKAGSSGVSPHVVAFKAELEKLREQVQNVE